MHMAVRKAMRAAKTTASPRHATHHKFAYGIQTAELLWLARTGGNSGDKVRVEG